MITPPLVFPWRTGSAGDTDIQDGLTVINGIAEGSVRREMAHRWGGPDLGLLESDPGESFAEAEDYYG